MVSLCFVDLIRSVRWPCLKLLQQIMSFSKQSKIAEELHKCNFILGNRDKSHVFKHVFLIRLPQFHLVLKMMIIPVFWDNKTLLLTHQCFPSRRVCDSLIAKQEKNKLLLTKSPKLCVTERAERKLQERI